MTAQPPNSFFTLKDGQQGLSVERLMTTADLQSQLAVAFNAQRGELLRETVDEIPFSGETLNADPGEILVINNFPLPPAVLGAVNNPAGVTPLEFTTTAAYQIKSVFSGPPAQEPEILFQAFNRARMISNQLTIFHMNGTFHRLENPALVLDSRLAAIYRNGNLYFRSYQIGKAIFDLTPYYKESSNEEITDFLNEGTVGCASTVALLANIDTIGRKKLTLIRASNVLGQLSVQTIVTRAKKHKVGIKTEPKPGGGRRIVFPTNRKELKAVLSFLNQDIYEAPLTQDGQFLSRSKTRLP